MIKFDNLKKACEELGFKIESQYSYLNVFDEKSNLISSLHSSKLWDLNFTSLFNYLETSVKAKLINAITRDYEEFLNGDD